MEQVEWLGTVQDATRDSWILIWELKDMEELRLNMLHG